MTAPDTLTPLGMSSPCRVCNRAAYATDRHGPIHRCCRDWAAKHNTQPCPACAASRAHQHNTRPPKKRTT